MVNNEKHMHQLFLIMTGSMTSMNEYVEYLLCAGHCTRCWGHSREQNKDHSPNGTDTPEGERVKPFKV